MYKLIFFILPFLLVSDKNITTTDTWVKDGYSPFIHEAKVWSLKLNKDRTEMEIIWRSVIGVSINNHSSERVWKERIGIKDDKFVLLEKKHGEHIPRHFIEEKIIFEEGE